MERTLELRPPETPVVSFKLGARVLSARSDSKGTVEEVRQRQDGVTYVVLFDGSSRRRTLTGEQLRPLPQALDALRERISVAVLRYERVSGRTVTAFIWRDGRLDKFESSTK